MTCTTVLYFSCHSGSYKREDTMPLRHSPTLQALINSHDNPFVLIDDQYCIVAANGAYECAYDVKASEVVGKRCYEISHRIDKPCWQNGEDCPHREVFENNHSFQTLQTPYY